MWNLGQYLEGSTSHSCYNPGFDAQLVVRSLLLACKRIGWQGDVEDQSGFAGSVGRSWKYPLQAFEAVVGWPAAWPVEAGQLEDVAAAVVAGRIESLGWIAERGRQGWKEPWRIESWMVGLSVALCMANSEELQGLQGRGAGDLQG